MRQLIYTSQATALGARDMALTLEEVLSHSIQNNRLVDVTGFLLIRDGMFLQLLEGPERSVETTFRRIAADERHAQISVISDTQGARRLFSEWNMGAVRDSGPSVRVLDAQAARHLLQTVAEQHRAAERQALLG